MMRRRLLFSFLLLISIVGFANAQKADTLGNAPIQKIYDLIKAKGKPLIVINGIIYNNNSNPFDTKNISAIEFLKPPGSTNIYGSQAVDGAIFITAGRLDTTNYTLMKIDSAIYILDGELSSKNKIEGLKPEDIVSIDILKRDKMSDPSLSQIKGDIVMAVTKAAAIKSYQTKFSRISKAYAIFFKTLPKDDTQLVYLINGDIYKATSKEGIEKLYKLPIERVKSIRIKIHDVADGFKLTDIVITTN